MRPARFVPGSSPVHSLDARAKLICLLILIAATAAAASPAGYILAAAATAAIAAAARLPARLALGTVARLWSFFVVIFLMNALFYGGEEPIASFWIFRLTNTGMRQGLQVVVRVALIVVLGGALTLTTAPMELTGALESLISPLRFIGVPTGDVAMIIGAALGFIPTLMEETDAIRLAQTARGAGFESRSVFTRAAALPALVIPVFISAFRRADELALAMEARGYRRAQGRPPKKRGPLTIIDYAALLLCTALLTAQLLLS